MDIAIVGRHTKVSDDLRTKILDKMDKIQALAPKATRADVHVVHERNPRLTGDTERVEITLHDRGVIRAEASAGDRVAALELATARIIERLRKIHERKAHRHQGKVGLHAVPTRLPEELTRNEATSVEAWEGAPEGSVVEVPLDGTPISIRSKRHAAVPMTVPQAIDEMELVGHDFFLFLDADSGLPSAVYRRRGWTYGVIHLEQSAADADLEPGERHSA
jgi:ribosomal subunit interface protein